MGAAEHLILNQDMRRERIDTGSNRPDVYVMHFLYPVDSNVAPTSKLDLVTTRSHDLAVESA